MDIIETHYGQSWKRPQWVRESQNLMSWKRTTRTASATLKLMAHNGDQTHSLGVGVMWSNLLAQVGSFYNTLHRIASRQFLSISTEGDFTGSLDNLFQCSHCTVKKLFLVFRWNFPGIRFCPLPLVLSPGTTEKSLAPYVDPFQQTPD